MVWLLMWESAYTDGSSGTQVCGVYTSKERAIEEAVRIAGKWERGDKPEYIRRVLGREEPTSCLLNRRDGELYVSFEILEQEVDSHWDTL